MSFCLVLIITTTAPVSQQAGDLGRARSGSLCGELLRRRRALLCPIFRSQNSRTGSPSLRSNRRGAGSGTPLSTANSTSSRRSGLLICSEPLSNRGHDDEHPALSIITPVLNGEAFIGDAIRSVHQAAALGADVEHHR